MYYKRGVLWLLRDGTSKVRDLPAGVQSKTEGLGPLQLYQWWDWLLLVVIVVFFGVCEGWRGFWKGFAPCLVRRAFEYSALYYGEYGGDDVLQEEEQGKRFEDGENMVKEEQETRILIDGCVVSGDGGSDDGEKLGEDGVTGTVLAEGDSCGGAYGAVQGDSR